MKHVAASLIVSLFATWTLAGEMPRPRLLLTPAGVTQLKDRIKNVDFVRSQYNEIKKRVDASLDKPFELPPRGGNWYHWYVCPTHGGRLNAGKQIGPYQWEHICPVDKQILKGDPSTVQTDFDGCRLQTCHRDLAAAVLEGGLVYQVTGDKRYAARPREILLTYANKYADYPLHTIRNESRIGGGKIGAQTLDESTWSIAAIQGADLVWDTLSDANRNTIATKLFGPIAREVILPHKMGVHNIQCWKNSAVGLIGLLLDDKELIAAAIDDPKSGFRVQMSKGVLADGLWWEGAWGYHFYTISACQPLVEAARNCGINLYTDDYKRLFDGPLNFARPDLVLPDFNDSHEVNVRGNAPHYEIAYARWKDPRYIELLAGSDRTDLFAMLYGEATLPKPPVRQAKSTNYTNAGFAILQKPAGNDSTWLCMDYGPHGGGHGHPDKLSFVLYARGKVLAPDGGITSYGTPLHSGWFRTSLAHNTLTIDLANQKEVTGKCLAFGSQQGADFVMADAGPIGKGIRFVRTVAMLSGDAIVIIDQIHADAPHTYDLALHLKGQVDPAPAGAAFALPEKPGYKYLKDACETLLKDPASLSIKSAGGPIKLAVATRDPATLLTATGPGKTTADRVPVAIVRQKDTDLHVAWVISLNDKTPKILFDVAKAAPGQIPVAKATVQLGDQSHIIEVDASQPESQRVKITRQ